MLVEQKSLDKVYELNASFLLRITLMNNLIQYATILSANGIQTRFNSSGPTIDIVDVPKPIKKITGEAVKEISHFADTANAVDNMAALMVADFIDDHINPISETSRLQLLSSLAIMHEGKYIRQSLALQLQNRSWHPSGIPNDCEHFGNFCTHRGIEHDPNRKGRTSSRKPNEYHVKTGDIIAREQLVTPNLRALFKSIPNESLVSSRTAVDIPAEVLRAFKKLPDLDSKLALIHDLEQEIA